jgi:hypothetical protein
MAAMDECRGKILTRCHLKRNNLNTIPQKKKNILRDIGTTVSMFLSIPSAYPTEEGTQVIQPRGK